MRASSIGDQARERSIAEFVGRTHEKETFAQALRELVGPPDDRGPDRPPALPTASVFLVSGFSGAGKSELLLQFEEISRELGALWVTVDPKAVLHEVSTLPALLYEIERVFVHTHRGRIASTRPFEAFHRALSAYQRAARDRGAGAGQPQQQREPPAYSPSPTASPFHERLGHELLVEAAPEVRPEWRKEPGILGRLMGWRPAPDERGLCAELAKALFGACGGKPLVLMLDSYERLLPVNAAIQRTLLAELLYPVLIVLAGQCDFIEEGLMSGVGRRSLVPLPLGPLSEDEAHELLDHTAITHGELRTALIRATTGMPGALRTAAELIERRYQGQQDEALADLRRAPLVRTLPEVFNWCVPSWLNSLPRSQVPIVQAACVLRQFDRRTLAALLDQVDEADLESLGQFRGVDPASERSFTVRDHIRHFIREHLRQDNRPLFDALNQRAADCHCPSLDEGGKAPSRMDDEAWCRGAVERAYHLAGIWTPAEIAEVTDGLAHAIWYHKHEFCLQLLDAAVDAGVPAEDREWMVSLRAAVEATRQGGRKEAIGHLRAVLTAATDRGYQRLEQIAHDCMGDHCRATEMWTEACEHLTRAARYFEEHGEFYKLGVAREQLAECAEGLGQAENARKPLELAAKAYERAAAAGHEYRLEALANCAMCVGRAGEPEEAESRFRSLLDEAGDDPDVAGAWALFLEDQKRWEDAIAAHEHAADMSEEKRPGALERVGRIHRDHLKDLGSAIEAYERSYEADRDSPSALIAIGTAYETFDKWAEAVEAWERVAEAAPDRRVEALAQAARCAGRAGDAEDAESRFRRLLEEAADDVEVLTRWALSLEDQERWEDALGAHEQVADTSEEYRAAAWEYVGTIHGDHLKDLGKAIEAYERSYEADRDQSSALIAIGTAYQRFEKWAEAVEAWERVAEAVPDRRLVALAQAARCAGRAGQAEDAESRFRSLLEEAGEDPEIAGLWALFLEDEKRWEDALAAHERVAELSEEYRPTALEYIGKIHRDQLKDLGKAIEAYERVYEADRERPSGLIAIGNTYEAFDKWAEAVEAWERVAAALPDRRSAALAQAARCAGRAGQAEEAESRFRSLLDAAPDDAQVLARKAAFLRDQERWEDALEAHERVAELSEEHRAAALDHIGTIYRDHLKDLGKAIEAYERSYEADPDRSSALIAIGHAYEDFDKWAEAVAAWERVAEAAPDKRLGALAEAARCVGKAGQAEEAESRFRSLLEEAGDDPDVAGGWALFLEDEERWEDAIAAHEHVADMSEKKRPGALEHVGRIYRDHLKDLEEAIRAYERSYEADPDRSSALVAIGGVYEAFEKWPEAVEAWERVAALAPGRRVEALAEAARCAGRAGQAEDAESRFRSLLKEAPDDVEVVARWALFLERQKRWEDAIAAHGHVADVSEEYRPAALDYVGAIYRDHLKDLEKAIEAYERSHEADPDRSSALIAIGHAYEGFDRWPEAVKAWERVAEAAPDKRLEAQAEAARCAGKAGDAEDAESRFRLLLEEAGDDPEVVGAWALFLQDQQRWEDAIAAREHVADISEEERAAALEHVGRIYRDHLKDLGKAIKAYERSYEADRDRSSPLVAIGSAYEAFERWPEAVKAWERVAEAAPDRRLEALAEAARCAGKAGDAEDAESRFRSLLEEAPDAVEVLARWALFLEEQERWEDAIGAHEHVADMSEGNRAAALEQVGRIYRDHLKDLGKAIEAYERSYGADSERSSALVGMASTYEAFGKWEQAAEAHQRVAAAAPELSISASARAARCLGKGDQAEEAENRFRSLLEQAPDQPYVAEQWAGYLTDQARWSEAVTTWEAFAASFPQHRAAVFEAIGAIYRDHLKDLGKAIEAYQESYEAEEGRLSALIAIGNTYQVFEKWPEAVEAWERIAEAAPDKRLEALAEAAGCAGKAGDAEDAESRFRSLLEEAPDDVQVLARWTVFLEGQERWEDAIAGHERVAELSEEYRPGALEYVGRIYRDHLKDLGKAIEAYGRSYEADRDRSSALIGIGSAYGAFEKWPEAAEAWERVAEATPDKRLEALAEVARCLGRAGQAEEAESRFRSLLAEAGDDPEVAGAWGLFLEDQERWEDAIGAHERIAELSEEYRPAALEHVGRIYRDHLKDLGKAIEAYQGSYEADPDRPSALIAIGHAYEDFDKWPEAVEAWERVAAAAPDRRIEALAQAARCAGRSRQAEEAEARFRSLLEEAPRDVGIAVGWAGFLEEQKRWEEAIAAYERVSGLSEEYRSAAFRRIAEICLQRTGDPQRSCETLLLLAEEEPDDLNILIPLARAREALGQEQETQAVYAEVVTAIEAAEPDATAQRRLGWARYKLGDLETGDQLCSGVPVDALDEDRVRACLIRAAIACLRSAEKDMRRLIEEAAPDNELSFTYVWEAVHDIRAVTSRLKEAPSIDSFVAAVEGLAVEE